MQVFRRVPRWWVWAMLVACGSRSAPPAAELWIGGDVHLGAEGDAQAMLGQVTRGLPAVGVINLEGEVVREVPASSLPGGFTLASRLPSLAAAGVQIAGVGNDHLPEDAGRAEAVVQTVREAGLIPVGGPARVAVTPIAGLRVVVTEHWIRGEVPSDLGAQLITAKSTGDVLIAMFHTDALPSHAPTREVRIAAGIALDAGAAVVAVQGSHLLGAIERRGGQLVLWGLGNLALACCSRETEAMVVRLALTRDGVRDAWVVPIVAGVRGQPATRAADPAPVLARLRALVSAPLTPDALGLRIGDEDKAPGPK